MDKRNPGSTYVSKRKKATSPRRPISSFGKGVDTLAQEINDRKLLKSPTTSPAKKKQPKATHDEEYDQGGSKKPPNTGTTPISSVVAQISTLTPIYVDKSGSNVNECGDHQAEIVSDEGSDIQTREEGREGKEEKEGRGE